MPSAINGFEKSISAIFSDEFAFEIPRYQRPYAWTTENAEELLSDLDDYLDDNDDINEITPYFLGNIVLIKQDNIPDAQVIDGQQRLTTLTILLSVLRHFADKKNKAHLTKRIYESEDDLAGTSERPRLTIRKKDKDFFKKYIQEDEDGITELEKLNPVNFDTDSKRNIYHNTLKLKQLVEAMPIERQQKLAKFILQRCFLVVVTAPNQNTAYRIFSVLNQRGLELSLTDILKADITGEIKGAKLVDEYTDKWEDIEEELGREAFDDLFSHIRMIRRKVKAKGTTLKEIQELIRPQDNPIQFIDDVLTPLSFAYRDIVNEHYIDGEHGSTIKNYFKFLKRIGNFDWLPPALLYLSMHKNEPDLLVKFFEALERLASGMMIMRVNINNRIKRYSPILSLIEDDADLYQADSPLNLTDDEKAIIRENLNGNLYETQYARYILLRIDSLLSSGEAQYMYPVISIEHVLPQSPSKESEWVKNFGDEEQRAMYTHRLGNLVLLSMTKNRKALNYDFQTKKTTYFTKESAPFLLTAQVRDETEWTPEVVEKRQKDLLSKLISTWKLD